MNETEWKLRKENAALRMALAEAQSRLIHAEHQAAKADSDALGAAWVSAEAETCTAPP